MPVLGLGTHSLHGETCKSAVLSAISQGYRLIDTAHMYGNEREIGEAIRQSGVPREEIFVITKISRNAVCKPRTGNTGIT